MFPHAPSLLVGVLGLILAVCQSVSVIYGAFFFVTPKEDRKPTMVDRTMVTIFSCNLISAICLFSLMVLAVLNH